jgi:hypothetical protein
LSKPNTGPLPATSNTASGAYALANRSGSLSSNPRLVGDYHLPNTVAWHLAREPRATDDRMLELLEPWAGHRWRVIRLAEASGGAPRYGPKLSLAGDGLHLGR